MEAILGNNGRPILGAIVDRLLATRWEPVGRLISKLHKWSQLADYVAQGAAPVGTARAEVRSRSASLVKQRAFSMSRDSKPSRVRSALCCSVPSRGISC